ncbi:MAG: small multi-drug export protein, partial [Candidatus Omnitrophota bacterium]
MIEKLVSSIQHLPNSLVTIIVAALPVLELRGAIPLALCTLKEPFLKTFLLSILGNLLPVVPFLFLLKPFSERARHFKLWSRFFDYIFAQAKKKAALIERYEALGLMLFVAVPLPGTGAWTGCIAASLFKIRFRYAVGAISLGVFIAAIIVSILTVGGKYLFT